MRPRWRATIGDDAWRTSDRVAPSYALKHGPATSGLLPFCSTPLLSPGNADQSRRQPVEIDGKLMDVIVTRPRDYKQRHRRGQAGKGRYQYQQARMDVACERGGQRGAEGTAVDHDRLVAIERSHGVVRSARIGIQLRLTFDVAGALAVT